MALKDLFGKKKEPPKKMMLVQDGKVVREDNPLPELMSGLYEQEPQVDAFAHKDEILKDAETITLDLLYACRLPRETVPKLILSNIGLLLDIPMIYDLFLSLKRQKFEQYYENNLALLALAQTCAFYTRSEAGQKLRDHLMPTLVGISLRYLGVVFLKHEDRGVLRENRVYDVSNARQKDLRDQFLKRYCEVADRVATDSVDRLHKVIGDTHGLTKERYKELLQIIRYSTRLMGRAAAELKIKERDSVYAVPCYIAMLYNFASAWKVKKKRAPLILAEEWGRCRQSFSKKDFEGRVSQSMQALSDLFHISRCQVIANFQESGRDAIYSTSDRIVVKQVKMVAELKDGSDSVRRFVYPGANAGGAADSEAKRRTAGDIRSRLRETDEKSVEVHRAKVQFRWQCFKCKVPVQYQARSLMEALEKQARHSQDPDDDQLIPLDE